MEFSSTNRSDQEVEGKRIHDLLGDAKMMYQTPSTQQRRRLWVPGPIIVGAGPSGLATAACLKERGIPSLILERSNCIASLWQLRTYDRLKLHLPKKFCELPFFPFPPDFPSYPTKQQFISYLESYARHFGLEPAYNQEVQAAEFDKDSGFWRVRTQGLTKLREETEYVSQWLVVATGENAEEVVPVFEGMEEFLGPIMHSSGYRSGDCFRGKSVLVVGCGNSGMEVSLDLCNHNAHPSVVVRDSVHVLPREMLGWSTFGLSMELMKWLPVGMVDRILLLMSRVVVGNTAQLGFHRPKIGPLQLKSITGKTPVLDVGTLAKIRTGDIKVVRGIKRLMRNAVEFVDGTVENFDAIILATGYKSNVPTWLKENNLFSEENGFPRQPFPEGWKGQNGLYAVGFTRRGLLGSSLDAARISEDVHKQWQLKAVQFTATTLNS